MKEAKEMVGVLCQISQMSKDVAIIDIRYNYKQNIQVIQRVSFTSVDLKDVSYQVPSYILRSIADITHRILKNYVHVKRPDADISGNVKIYVESGNCIIKYPNWPYRANKSFKLNFDTRAAREEINEALNTIADILNEEAAKIIVKPEINNEK